MDAYIGGTIVVIAAVLACLTLIVPPELPHRRTDRRQQAL